MSLPFAHGGAVADNAATDHSFDTDQGVPARHITSFTNAMAAPNHTLGEEDYRYPYARPGGDQPVQAPPPDAAPPQPWRAPGQQIDGYYPKGYAP